MSSILRNILDIIKDYSILIPAQYNWYKFPDLNTPGEGMYWPINSSDKDIDQNLYFYDDEKKNI